MSKFVGQALTANVIQKLLFNFERAPDERDVGLPVGFDAGDVVFKIVRHMAWIGWRADGADGVDFVDLPSRDQHGRTAQ